MSTPFATGTAPRPRSPGAGLRTRIVLAGLSAVGLAALAWAAFMQPLGARLTSPPVGGLVLTALPPDAAALAAQRGYLPLGVPLLKRVGAVAPQHVCVVDARVWIDGVPVAAVQSTDRRGRPLPSWRSCRALASGELFLLNAAHPASFDSRYFGPVDASAVIGVAHPLWPQTRP